MLTRFTLPALAAPLCATLITCTGYAAELPFNTLNGTWAGKGNLIYDTGPPDQLDCLGYYRSADGGKSLGIALRCNGNPDKLEFRSKLNYADGKLTGTWEERTNNATGSASGAATDKTLHLNFDGSFSGSISIDFTPSSQAISVTISTDGSELKGARVSLNRR